MGPLFLFILLLGLLERFCAEAVDNSYEAINISLSHPSGEVERKYHNWDCPRDENYMKRRLLETSRMLEDANTVMDGPETSPTPPETILVLGKAGCGKTSFVQLLAGNNVNLMSKEVGGDTGDYLIEDGLKIGNSVTDSFTLYPEVVEFNSSLAFLDTPGFSDTRSPSHEIVATNVMKKILERFPKIKIVLLAEYRSLQHGMDKGGFADLLRHLNNFISNIDKYKDKIVLVATKVRYLYTVKNGKPILIPDANIINSISDYLYQVKTLFKEKSTNSSDENESTFYENAMKVLEGVLEKDNEGNIKRINVFRRPYENGSLANMSLIQENRQSLLTTVTEYTEFANSETDDFDYTLSNHAKIYLDCLLRYVNEHVVQSCNKIFNSVLEYYRAMTGNRKDMCSLIADLKAIDKRLDLLQERLGNNTGNYISYLRDLERFADSQNVSVKSYEYENDTVVELDVYINTLEKFIDTHTILTPSSWAVPMKHVLRYIKDTLHWYSFLNGLFENLSSYRIQNQKELVFSGFPNDSLSGNVKFLLTNSHVLLDQIDLKGLDEITLTDEKIKDLDDVITATMKTTSNVTCDGSGKLVIKGNFIRISKISSKEKINAYCGDVPVNEIAVLAVYKVFIDADLSDKIFNGTNMVIAAPNWEVIGKREINLSGLDGEKIRYDKYIHANASKPTFQNLFRDENSVENDDVSLEPQRQGISASSERELNGYDGKPGLPGGNGGNFFGIGLNFLNGAALTVKLNGGVGGPGVDGMKGLPGRRGEDGSKKFQSQPPTDYNMNYSIYSGFREFPYHISEPAMELRGMRNIHSIIGSSHQTEEPFFSSGDSSKLNISAYEQEGECGGEGGNGGNGGRSGLGGNPGRQQIIELRKPSQINLENSPGSPGCPGKPGVGGPKGQTGIGVRCYRFQYRFSSYRGDWNTLWKCVDKISVCNDTDTVSIKGISNYTSVGIQQPSKPRQFDFSSYLLDYSLLLDDYSSNTLFSKTIDNFKNAIYKKFSYDHSEWWKFNFKNF